MGHIYLKFKYEFGKNSASKPKTGLTKMFQRSVIRILTILIPKANPDFDETIGNVYEWLIEIDEETDRPEREIGINRQGETIMIMPFDGNYGFWTDNNLRRNDFIDQFQATSVTKKEFFERWDKFEQRSVR